jgi:hypothetical protein
MDEKGKRKPGVARRVKRGISPTNEKTPGKTKLTRLP